MAVTFLEAVKRLISKWSALQIAIAHGMGGPFAREKEEWLCNVIAEFFSQNSDLHSEEVGEYIGEILNNEFDTLIEDGTLEDICERLTKYYGWFQSNDISKIRMDLDTIKLVEVPDNTGLHSSDECMSLAKDYSNPDYLARNGDISENMSSDVVTQMQELSLQAEDCDDTNNWTVVTRSKRGSKPK